MENEKNTKIMGRVLSAFVPSSALIALWLARSRKGQGSLEYIMMVAAASIVIVLALVMVVKLKAAVPSNVTVNGTSTSISSAISQQLQRLSGSV
ncbi:MAG: hypothetical protein QXF01_00445 [Candidatus Micrarchaeaceae archaeon]